MVADGVLRDFVVRSVSSLNPGLRDRGFVFSGFSLGDKVSKFIPT